MFTYIIFWIYSCNLYFIHYPQIIDSPGAILSFVRLPPQTGQTKTKVVELYTYFDKITNKDGHSVTLRINPRSKDIVAIVHTHPFGRGDNTTWFSTEDEIQASTFNIFVYAYGPDGDLRKLNPFTHKNILVPAELPLPAQ